MKRKLAVALLLLVSSSAFGQDQGGLARFREQVSTLHVGDRILVDLGSDISPRAEIVAVTKDGYKVTLWDKAATAPNDATPWTKRANVREVVLPRKEVDRLNGPVKRTGPYWLNTWLIDPASDPVLAERIAKAQKAAAELLPASVLELPKDPAQKKARLGEIAALQRKLLDRIFEENPMSQPRRDPQALDRRTALLNARPELRGRIGAALESRCGDSYDQSAAIVAILHAISSRAGLDAVALGGRTIGQVDAHEFIAVRLANGELGAFDPSWHDPKDTSLLEDMDFATYDSRRGSNRNIQWISEERSRFDRGFQRGGERKGLTSVFDRALDEKVAERVESSARER